MGVDKHFKMYVKLEDKDKAVDRFLHIYEKHFGKMELFDTAKDPYMYDIDAPLYPSGALKRDIQEKGVSGNISFWDTNSGGHIDVYNREDGKLILEIYAYGRARHSYEELFGQYMRIAKETGNCCYQAYSEAEDAPYDGKGYLEVAYDKPYHKITDKEGIEKVLKNLGISRYSSVKKEDLVQVKSERVENSKENEVSPFVYTHHDFSDVFAESLYNVDLNAVDKESAGVQDLFRLLAKGKEGTIADCRNEGYDWDNRTICFASGAEEYLLSVTHKVENVGFTKVDMFQASLYACIEKSRRSDFIKELNELCIDNKIAMETVLSSNKEARAEYDLSREILFVSDRKDMPLENIRFSEKKEKPAKEVISVYLRPDIFTRIKEDGKTTGISINGYKDPDGKYHTIRIPFKKNPDITVSIIRKEGATKGGAFVKLVKNAVLDVDINKKNEILTLAPSAFKQFIENKNRKAERTAEDKSVER